MRADTDYDVTYADGRRTIVLIANLARGWRRLPKTYGFSRQMWIHYPGDYRVRTQLQLVPRPATFDKSLADFPDGTLEGGTELTKYRIEQKMLSLRICLCKEQPWRQIMGKRPGIFFHDELVAWERPGPPLQHEFTLEQGPSILAQDGNIQISLPYVQIDLNALVVFHSTDRRAIPDVRVWCQKLFVPAGQFESNRKRH